MNETDHLLLSRAYPSIWQQGRGDHSEQRIVRVDDFRQLLHTLRYDGWAAMMHPRFPFHIFNMRVRQQLAAARVFFLKQCARVAFLQ